MAKKMLVDATHPEETRVVVVQGTRLEDFDFESAARKQLIGNIYLARVTRIEPSLQAAFVEYGGNRHGFLAFNEIHPDYYQIPVADRRALLEADAAEEQRAQDADEDVDFKTEDQAAEDAGDDDAGDDGGDDAAGSDTMFGNVETVEETGDDSALDDGESDAGPGRGPMLMASGERDFISSGPLVDTGDASEDAPGGALQHEDATESASSAGVADQAETWPATQSEPVSEDGTIPVAADRPSEESRDTQPRVRRSGRRRPPQGGTETQGRQDGGWDDVSPKRVESVGGEDALDEVSRPRSRRRQYKIQEVIKKRQIMLVQILKDERGSKGAALTTYLSIPGRYCVLMPNTARGGGISRKITNAVDRKRLKAVAAELEVPEGMGLIIRTAGANRTKAEIKRDFDYLLRQWETIRELTLRSTAPCLINEEGSIVKRAVRDLYDKDIEIIQVEGEASYREAKDFMRMLMPSHARRVQHYKEPVPLFQRYQVEAQLDSMFDPTVRLKSGGYIVINPTEALVSIDVNSGKATREANIEATALKTNMEAAEELARQLRLRDLAGLIVVDFIDMENLRNNKAVERRIKECLATDRANIQIGRISPFGLLEMSRQRLRQGVVETTTRPCSNCHGTGLVRSVDSLALRVLRGIEEECQRSQHHVLDVFVPSDVAIYILNQKRQWLHQIEARAAASIFIIASDAIQSPNFEIKPSGRIAVIPPPMIAAPETPEIAEEDEIEEPQAEANEQSEAVETQDSREGDRKRRRRRGRGDEPRNARTELEPVITENRENKESSGLQPIVEAMTEAEASEEEVRRRKIRRRRRGRGRNPDRDEARLQPMPDDVAASHDGPSDRALVIPILPAGGAAPEMAEGELWHPQSVASALAETVPEPEMAAEEQPSPTAAIATEIMAAPEPEPAKPDEAVAAIQPEPSVPEGPKRGGWWQRQFGKA